MVLKRRPKLEQYKLNVEYLLAGYANAMADQPGEYEAMTLEQITSYVNAQVYDFIYDGCGWACYNQVAAKMAKEMKFLPKAAKINICYEIAKDCGVLKEN